MLQRRELVGQLRSTFGVKHKTTITRALQLLRGAPDGIPARQHAFLLLLWVELYYESGRVFVNGCGFSEIEDAVGAVQEFVDPAKRMQDGS
jgi:hypothetical protein